MRRKILFWVVLCASFTLIAVPSVLMFENIRTYARTVPPDDTAPASGHGARGRAATTRATAGNTAPDVKFIRFSFKSADAKAVFLEGDFNLWKKDRLPLKKEDKNKWNLLLPLPPGRYRYRFVVDGKETLDPDAKETDKVDEEQVSVKLVP